MMSMAHIPNYGFSATNQLWLGPLRGLALGARPPPILGESK